MTRLESYAILIFAISAEECGAKFLLSPLESVGTVSFFIKKTHAFACVFFFILCFYGGLEAAELEVIQFGILTVEFHEFFVRAALGYLSVHDDRYFIGVSYR